MIHESLYELLYLTIEITFCITCRFILSIALLCQLISRKLSSSLETMRHNEFEKPFGAFWISERYVRKLRIISERTSFWIWEQDTSFDIWKCFGFLEPMFLDIVSDIRKAFRIMLWKKTFFCVQLCTNCLINIEYSTKLIKLYEKCYFLENTYFHMTLITIIEFLGMRSSM